MVTQDWASDPEGHLPRAPGAGHTVVPSQAELARGYLPITHQTHFLLFPIININTSVSLGKHRIENPGG